MMKHLAVLICVALLASCAAPVQEQEQSGFLADYSKLEKVEGERAYQYLSPSIANYKKFIVDEPRILFEVAERGENNFSQEELDEIVAYFRAEMIKRLSEDDAYQIVDEAGEGVARVRLGLTSMDATMGALNVTIYTKITGAGLGGAAMEGEIVDATTGEQLASTVQWGSGSRVLRAGFTRLGDAKIQINRWSKDMRSRIDAASASASGN